MKDKETPTNVKSKTRLPLAIVTHTGKKLHLCTLCNKAFPTEEGLGDHLVETHRHHQCQFCNKISKTDGVLKEHLLTHCNMNPPKCVFCAKEFTNLPGLKRHMALSAHTGDEGIFVDNRHKQCNICGKTLHMGRSFWEHTLVHKGIRSYKCTTCGKTFYNNGKLKEHARIHTGEKPYQCAICGKTLRMKAHARQHSLLHKGKGYQCSVCGKAFRWKADLVKHS